MSSACLCHIDGEWCFYCEMFLPLEAENQRLKAEVKAESLRAAEWEGEAQGYAEKNDLLLKALREIDGHIRATNDPIPHIVATLKRALPEYYEGGGDFFAS